MTWDIPEIPPEAQRNRENHLASPFLQHSTLQLGFPTGWIHWKVSWHASLGNAASMAARAEQGRGLATILQEVFKNYTWRVLQYFWWQPYCGFFLELAPHTNVLAKSEYGITCVAITVTVVVVYLHTGIYPCANKGPSSQDYGFSCGHVWMWELDYKESWAPKKLMLLNCGVGGHSWESFGLQGDPTSPF